MPVLDWIGKDKVINHHMDVQYKVLDYQYTFSSESGQTVVEDLTNNKIIRGDNLEALKALLPQYEGKIKCIYIDPPYNTGNEGWVYNDSAKDPKILKWLGKVVGKEGEDLSRHDKWLCMMYPRLKLLQRLLAEDGFIFVSIDVFEYAHLKMLMDEIFGSQNFRNCIAVRRGIKNVQAQFKEVHALSLGHEYIYLYSKKSDTKLPKLSVQLDNEKAGKWDTFWRGTDRPTMRYEIYGVCPEKGQWRWETGRAHKAMENYSTYVEKYSDDLPLDDYYIDALLANNDKMDFVRKSEAGVIQYYVPPQSGRLLSDNWMDILLSGSYTGFDTEKNVLLMERIFRWVTSKDDIILDSFAGSGTTAHAVLNLNAEDGEHRKYILIEMMDYAEDITAKRVKKVIHENNEGSFNFYDLGKPLLLENQMINESVDTKIIRQYIYFMETRQIVDDSVGNEPYYLGSFNDVAFYFNYEKNKITTLNHAFLSTIGTKAEGYIIYADKNALSETEMQKYLITFKKIPRDIAKL